MSGHAGLVRGDALQLPLRDGSVDLIVTSPPYFSQRSYRDGDEHYAGQIGDEETPQAFLEALWAVTAECWRVLKADGNVFVNLGDKRSGSGGPGTTTGLGPGTAVQGARSGGIEGQYRRAAFGRPKSKMLLPHRYAIGCEDGAADPDGVGWVVCQDLVWWKKNAMPESVRDRARDEHEYWFHLTKQGRHYAAVDELREPHAAGTAKRYAQGYGERDATNAARLSVGYDLGGDAWHPNPLGRAPGSVWPMANEPLRVPEWLEVEHFAAFPTEWPRRLILGWSPSSICLECGEGRWPVVTKSLDVDHFQTHKGGFRDLSEPDGNDRGTNGASNVGSTVVQIVGYACACTPSTNHRGTRGDWREGRDESDDHGTGFGLGSGDVVPRRPGGFGTRMPPPSVPVVEYDLDGWTPPPSRPAVVLDPFGGTGTTAMVARALGRVGVSIDLSSDYLRLARWRVFESGQSARIATRTESDRQGALFR